jgi:hypothetical protein
MMLVLPWAPDTRPLTDEEAAVFAEGAEFAALNIRQPAPRRLWFAVNRQGQIGGVYYLTDEQALERFDRGEDLRPVQDESELRAEWRVDA